MLASDVPFYQWSAFVFGPLLNSIWSITHHMMQITNLWIKYQKNLHFNELLPLPPLTVLSWLCGNQFTVVGTTGPDRTTGCVYRCTILRKLAIKMLLVHSGFKLAPEFILCANMAPKQLPGSYVREIMSRLALETVTHRENGLIYSGRSVIHGKCGLCVKQTNWGMNVQKCWF